MQEVRAADSASVDADLRLIAEYLARRDVPELSTTALGGPCAVVVLAGSSVLQAAHVAAAALHAGVASSLLVTGGIGHSTNFLVKAITDDPRYRSVGTLGRTEAAILSDVLVNHLGVDSSAIVIEDRSSNCGENATYSRRKLDESGIVCASLVLVQDPTMQRRSHACFERAWKDRPATRIVSFAPFVPVVRDGVATGEEGGPAAWPPDRFASLVLGEVRRLHDDEQGYGPRGAGFIDHVDVPARVLAASRRLEERFAARLR